MRGGDGTALHRAPGTPDVYWTTEAEFLAPFFLIGPILSPDNFAGWIFLLWKMFWYNRCALSQFTLLSDFTVLLENKLTNLVPVAMKSLKILQLLLRLQVQDISHAQGPKRHALSLLLTLSVPLGQGHFLEFLAISFNRFSCRKIGKIPSDRDILYTGYKQITNLLWFNNDKHGFVTNGLKKLNIINRQIWDC
jgi:hypothetical protein